jgi:hypothetical protein
LQLRQSFPNGIRIHADQGANLLGTGAAYCTQAIQHLGAVKRRGLFH